MNKLFTRIGPLLVSISFLGFIIACDDEPPLPDNLVNFESASVGLEDNVSEINVNINLSRAESEPVNITIAFTTNGVAYGEAFTTAPAAVDNKLTVTIPANASTASFKVMRNENVFLTGEETITFSIENAGEPLIIGSIPQIILSFSSIVSEGSQLVLQGLAGSEPGASAANSVFVDFSSNTQTPVLRTSWDLGFYGGEQFRVILNNTTGASALMIDKTDINDVALGDVNTDALAIPLAEPGAASFSMIDDIHGDITKTIIAEVSETAENNKVYVINRSGGTMSSTIVPENLVKIRVLRNANGYTLQYAKLAETTFESIEISKSQTASFNYISFGEDAALTASEVSVAPPAWDIQWTWSIYYGLMGEEMYPYGFSDIVFVNSVGGTKAAEVLTSVITYEAFSEENLSELELKAERNVIGSNWRITSGGSVGVRNDRFYVVQDADGNVYKLKFINFHPNDGGTRGKPVIEYAIVRKGN